MKSLSGDAGLFIFNSSFRNFKIDVPLKTRRNGTLYLYVVMAKDDGALDWKDFQRDGPTVIQRIPLTDYMIPKDILYNLLENEQPSEIELKKKKASKSNGINAKPVAHIRNKVFVSILTDRVSMSPVDIPPELARMVRVSKYHEFLPMIQNNVLKGRVSDMIEVTKNLTELDLEFNYAPVGVGKLRLVAHLENAMGQLTQLGFSSKDIDEVKGIFADTNVYLLCGTLFVGSIHVSIIEIIYTQLIIS